MSSEDTDSSVWGEQEEYSGRYRYIFKLQKNKMYNLKYIILLYLCSNDSIVVKLKQSGIGVH